LKDNSSRGISMKNFEKFCDAFINAIYREYDANDFKYDSSDRNLTSVLAGYISLFTTKFVIDTPRKVHISAELQSKLNKDAELKDLVEFMIEKIEAGKNINGHLTRQIYDTTITDKLYSDWEITHLHLNKTEASTNEEMKHNREGDLLFAIFNSKDCYLIDAKSHNIKHVFALMEYLKIMVDNWPRLFLIPASDLSITCVSPVKNDQDVIEFRKANVNVICYEINNTQYVKTKPTGITSAGTDHTSQRIAMNFVKAYDNINDDFVGLDYKFLCNNFGAINCVNSSYSLGYLYPPAL